jgi:tRNA-dihydrouridine synthase B
LKPILYLAPLHGITNSVFRNTFFKYFTGFDYAMAPFVMSVKSLNVRRKHVKDLLPEKNVGVNLIPQILSNDPSDFIALSLNLKDLGYKEINWNLGCPYKMVANKQRGSGLLPFPERIEKFLEVVIAEVDIPISVKIRLGRNSNNEIFDLIPIFNKFPLKNVIIHPRTGVQMYTGEVDLDKFEESSNLIKHNVIYNGDIKDFETFKMLENRFEFVNEWMIGRWALSNPFLPEIIKKDADDIKNKKKIIRNFHDELYSNYEEVLYGPRHLLDKMKEIWNYLNFSFSNHAMVHKKISLSKTIGEYKKNVDSIFFNEDWI